MRLLKLSLAGLVASAVLAAASPAFPQATVAAQPAQAAPPPSQALPAGVVAVTSVEGIDEYRLANGLQVLLVPDDSKPTTTVNLTYRVGSRQESYGETGMAHLLEHMLFKGSPKNRDPKAELTRRGMSFNGSTSFDRTNYFASFAANDANLKWYLGGEADAMVNSYVARADLDSEMTVVRNEMERNENNAGRILGQRLLATMFDWHNYGHDVIGARSDVENVDIPSLQAFYHRYYQPDNATLIVSGRFDRSKTLAWIGDAFGAIPKPTRVLPVLYTLDPAQDGERSVLLKRAGGAPIVEVGYHVPAASSRDEAAVELIGIILGDTPSGRLYKRLTQRQLAASVDAGDYELADPSVFIARAQLAPGQDTDQARSALIASVESIAKEPFSADELARAKLKWLKDWDQAFTDPERVGIALSSPVALGDWRLMFLERDRVREATLADVQRVAEQYLVPDNRTLAIYTPTDKPVRAPAPVRVDLAQTMQDFKPQRAAAQVEAFDATPANIDVRTQTFNVGGIKAALLPKGTRGAAVTAVLTLHSGDTASLFGQSEIASAVGAMLTMGTTTMSREQIQDRLDQLKTSLRVSAAPGRVTVAVQSRHDELPAAIALVGELLRHPAFPADALDELKRASLTRIAQQRKEPSAIARNEVDRLGNPYRRGDPRYAETFDESAQAVASLTVEQLRTYHDRFFGAKRGEFAAVGDMDAAQVRAALQAALGDWSAGAAFTRIAEPLYPVKPERLLIATPDKAGAYMLVQQGVALNDTDPDYAALTLANFMFGSGSSSRLWLRIREHEGLSYGVGSSIGWSNLDRNSPWTASAIFAPQNRAKVETALREEVARARQDGFTAQELAQAKTGLLNYRQLSRSQDAGVASQMANNLYLDRTFAVSAHVDDAIARLSLDDVNAAFRKYVTPDKFVLVFAGDFKP